MVEPELSGLRESAGIFYALPILKTMIPTVLRISWFWNLAGLKKIRRFRKSRKPYSRSPPFVPGRRLALHELKGTQI